MIPSLVEQLRAASANAAGQPTTDKRLTTHPVPPSERNRARLLQRLALGHLATVSGACVRAIHAAHPEANTLRGWAYYMTVLVSLGYAEVVPPRIHRGRAVAVGSRNAYRITAMGLARLAELSGTTTTDNHQEH